MMFDYDLDDRPVKLAAYVAAAYLYVLIGPYFLGWGGIMDSYWTDSRKHGTQY